MATLTGIFIVMVAFFGGAALKENEIKSKTPTSKSSPPTLIEQAEGACDSGSMKKFQKGALKFECVDYGNTNRGN